MTPDPIGWIGVPYLGKVQMREDYRHVKMAAPPSKTAGITLPEDHLRVF